jgi:DNA-binding NarL/FixJ family response regulator
MREGLRTLLELHPDLRVAGEAADGLEAEALVEQLHPRVVLMDLRMPRVDGLEATRRINARWPEVRVVVLTTFDDDDLVFAAIEAGAVGYLLKDVGSDALADAVRAASSGESPVQPRIAGKLLRRLRSEAPAQKAEPELAEPFTPREIEILYCLGTGASNHEIADRLALTEGTVKNYVSTILSKTGLRDRTQAALYAAQHGFGERPGAKAPKS